MAEEIREDLVAHLRQQIQEGRYDTARRRELTAALVVEKVKEVKPDFVGFSALITSVFDAMKEAAEMLEEAGLRQQFKLMVGGGIATEMVKDYINADFYTTDAMEGVTYCMKS